IQQQRPELVLQEGVFTNEIDGYSIRVGKKDKNTKTLHDILIYDHTNGKANESVTVADSGYLRMTEDKKFYVMTLFSGENFAEEKPQSGQRNNYPFRLDKFEMQEINVPVKNFDFNRRDDNTYRSSYKSMSVSQLEYIEDSLIVDYRQWLRSFLKNVHFTIDLDKRLMAYAMDDDSLLKVYNGEQHRIFDYDSLMATMPIRSLQELNKTAISKANSNYQEINNIESNLYGRKKRINLHMMERYRKYTLSVAVFVFFLIGVPLGAIIRKGGLGMPVVVSILLFILYYIFSMTGEKSAREDSWSMSVGMWFSTLIFLPVGIWLTYKAITDSPVMNSETYFNFFKKLKRLFIKDKTEPDEPSAVDQ
ncbi:MAG: LptF/LptG family permease, partial [Prolixibacteraceae bacterium]|nr:LptF/LptG family permease [Prolixibacteraceae bacterium]